MTEPVDAAARARVRDDHASSIFIEAGAGTGKTTALVERVVALVARGAVELRELAAITFTEAAAAELRDRIRAGLEAAAAGAVAWVDDGAARARCRAGLDEIDDAALTTLHGFAQRLLTEYPLEAGLPPVFEVLDDIRARVRFEQRWGELVDSLFANPELEEALLRGIVLGLRFDHLRDAARTLHDNHDRVGPPDSAPPLPAFDVTPLVAALDVVIAFREECRLEGDRMAEHIDVNVVPLRDELVAGGRDLLDQLDFVAHAHDPQFRQGKDGNWRCRVQEVRDASTRASEVRADILNAQRRAVLATLVHHVVSFVREFADERRREGTLEFHDLLVLARGLLRSRPDVRAAASRRWRRILLDEFQDTDPLQIQLAALLATLDDHAGERAWHELTIEPGRLVVVGDPKQSIYRFRRADLRVYDAARTSLGLDETTLIENFRSVPPIIDFVNEVFTALLVSDEPGLQAPHVALHAHREALDDAGAAVSTFGDLSTDHVELIREQEADDVAAIVQQVKTERWLVSDRDGTTRTAEYADIAILIPSRTVLPGIEDSLERAAIPVRVESQSLLFATAEIRDLLSILTAVDDPSDGIAVVAALRAAAFGCSDRELADHVAAGGAWDYRVERDDVIERLGAEHPVVAGLRALRALWSERWWRSISETVEAVVRERRLLELAVARRRPRDHWRRTRFFLDQARAWDDAGAGTLRGFVEWAQEQAEERRRVIESVAPEPDDDAVRILTVHGAKGLEFPVVVLAGLSTQPPRFSPMVVWDADGCAEFMNGTKKSGARVETLGYDAAAKAEERHDRAERLRLLYVAMTRARDHLVVSLHRKEKMECHAQSIAAQLEHARFEMLEPGDPVHATSPPHGPIPVDEPAAYEAWSTARQAALARASTPASVAATTLASLDDEARADPGLAKDAPADDEPPWRRGRAGTAVGRAVHAVLQTVDLADASDLPAVARAQALAEGVPDREDDVRAFAQSALESPIVRAAIESGGRWWREVPVAATVDGVLLEGFVDLLVELDGELVVVDYKTDRVHDDRLEAALARYSVQGAAYALALEAALGRPVTRCVFVFARRGAAIERDVGDLDEAKRTARERLAAATAA
jgi:ATP-dependent exoDNAse (exonuclease V) beta subunit